MGSGLDGRSQGRAREPAGSSPAATREFAGVAARKSRGFVLVTLLASTAVVLAVVGLAIDVGYLQVVKIRMQTAADAAAIGGAQELIANGASNLVSAAKTDAALNGFTDGQNSVSITVNHPPATGFYTADPTAVEVLISQNVGVFFLSLAGFSSMGVQTRAVARQTAGSNCVYALDPNASGALTASGSVAVQVSCGIAIDSNNSSALTATGGAQISATSVSITGNESLSGGASVSPPPLIHTPRLPDPLSYLPAPAAGSCSQTNYHVSGGDTVDIGPGVYCKGIDISGGSQVNMIAGTYILKGGGLSVSGGSTLTGSGVTIFNTYGTGAGYRGISLSGDCTIQLSAPTTGTYAGILFFQDRTVASGASSSITGNSSSKFEGALYFPTTDLSYTGNATSSYTILVAKTVSFTGNTVVKSDYSSLPGGSPMRENAAVSE